jgi:Prophage CP4-57 regulatory protein (AlpA)
MSARERDSISVHEHEMTDMNMPTFLRLPQVEQIVGLKRSTIYALIQRGQFPDRIKDRNTYKPLEQRGGTAMGQ